MLSKRSTLLLTTVLVVFACRAAAASGLLIPEDRNLPPLAVQSHRVNADIRGGVATTRVSQVFLNSTDRRLEATFIFPLPADAALTDFAMFIDGKRQSGEVVEAQKARQVYEDIVRRLRDPGLLEYMDSGLLRLRVFPIEPRSSVKLEVSFTHALPFDSGVYEYTFPLRTGNKSSKVLEDFTVSVGIASEQPIKNVYSPTHDLGVTRKDDHHAIAGFEQTGVNLDNDFTLFYSIGREDFGLNLLTHRLAGQDGFFALMLAPGAELAAEKILAKDVAFVVDTSGSMEQQNRIAGARDAVKFCLGALNPKDRFAIVAFNTGVEVYGDGLTDATPEAVADAASFVGKMEARGGTALCEAVLRALEMSPGGDRPYLVVLVTDGKPTVGVTEPDEIVAQVKGANSANVRVFPFGIAESLDVPLLDRIAEATRGYSEYLAPGREIEAKISSFFRKVSYPVLSGLELSFGRIKVRDLYPQQLPDLFRGSQVVAFGRYSGTGEVAVTLSGSVEGRRKEFAYDASFPEVQSANDFLPQLWARRKIGYLLDQIRLHGRSDELVDEVVRLSKEYGIATPYTSYLVLENEDAYRQHGIVRGESLGALRRAGLPMRSRTPASVAQNAPLAERGRFAFAADALEGGGAGGPAGGDAVSLSTRLKEWKSAEALSDTAAVAAALKRVGDKSFVVVGGAFVDTAFDSEMPLLKVKWGSEAYFNVLSAMPELTDCLALGEAVVVVINGKALVIGDEGSETMSVEQIRTYFRD